MIGHVIGSTLLVMLVFACWRLKRQDQVKDAYDEYMRALRATQIKNQKPPKVPSAAVAHLIAKARRESFRRPRTR